MIFFLFFFGLPWEVIWGNLHPSVRRLARFNRLHGKVTDRAAAMLLLPLLQYFTGACDSTISIPDTDGASAMRIFYCLNTMHYEVVSHIYYNIILTLLLSLMEHPAIVYYCFCSTLLRSIVVFSEYNSNPPFNIWSTLPIVMRVFYHRCCFCHFQYHCDVF